MIDSATAVSFLLIIMLNLFLIFMLKIDEKMCFVYIIKLFKKNGILIEFIIAYGL